MKLPKFKKRLKSNSGLQNNAVTECIKEGDMEGATDKEFQIKPEAKGYIDYFNGLWVGGWVAYGEPDLSESSGYRCELKVNDVTVQNFTAQTQRPDLKSIAELKHGYGFDVQIPVNSLTEIIGSSETIKVNVIVSGAPVPHVKEVSVSDFYKSVFSELYFDVNSYVSVIPLFNDKSIEYLSQEQKLYLLDVLNKSNLSKVLNELVGSLYNSVFSSKTHLTEKERELLNSMRFSQSFQRAYLNNTGGDYRDHPYAGLILDALRQMRHMESREVIMGSVSDAALRAKLIEECSQFEAEKFEFIENYPVDWAQGLERWDSLTIEKKRDYWPLLAGSLQYLNRYPELKFIAIDPAMYVKDPQDMGHDELIRAAIANPDCNWFSLSFIVQSHECGRDPVYVSELMKEYSWSVWNLSYFDTDSFCYLAESLLKASNASVVIENLLQAFESIVKYKIHKNGYDLYRETFIRSIGLLISRAIRLQHVSVTRLEETVRPYYLLEDIYHQSIDISGFTYLDINHYKWISSVYGKAAEIIEFFRNFRLADHKESEMVIEKIHDLFYLNEKAGVKGGEKYVLSLSRALQLAESDYNKCDLIRFHEKVGDLWGAVQLSTGDAKVSLVNKIAESGRGAPIYNSAWFYQLLDSRKKGADSVCSYIETLGNYLLELQVNDRWVDVELARALLSECLWLVLSGEQDKASEYLHAYSAIFKNVAIKEYAAVKVALPIYQKSNYIFPDVLSEASRDISNFDIIHQMLSEYDETISSLKSTQDAAEFFTKVKQRNLFPYCKVLIYSCNKYIDSRHVSIRESWLPELIEYGIDYNFVVGGADFDHIEDDVMHLSVLDTYEELPKKSLGMFDYALQSSNHKYYYKLDDDCVLNVRAMFGDPAYIGKSYYGRTVTRPEGGVDRTWHHSKSASEAARNALDLSPECSHYCDGSTGYVVSREAAEKLIYQAGLAANTQLISASYFEDKLIGDLMAIAGVESSSDGYNTTVRRTVAGGRDVQIWEFGLVPNEKMHVKVLHTESDAARKQIGSALTSAEVQLPALIYRDATDSMKPKWTAQDEQPLVEILKLNQSAIASAKVIAIIVTKSEKEFLPNLLDHHRKIGVDHFLYVDNASVDSSIDYMMSQDDVSVFVATQDYKVSRFGVNWQETLLSHYCLGKWALLIDSDELFVYDQFEERSIHELISTVEGEGATAVLSPMIDFYPNGTLADADITEPRPFYKTCTSFDAIETMRIDWHRRYGPFSNSVVFSAGLRQRIFGPYNSYPAPNYLNQKYNLIRYSPGMKLVEGLHFMSGHKLFSKRCGIMHFKYHSGFHRKVLREVKAGQHWNGAKEYVRYLELFNSGKDASLYDQEFSIEYRSISSLVDSGYIEHVF